MNLMFDLEFQFQTFEIFEVKKVVVELNRNLSVLKFQL